MAVKYTLVFARAAMAAAAAIGGGIVCFVLGETFYAAVEGLLDPHWFDPKELLLASAFSGGVLGAAAGIWLALALTNAGKGWLRGALLLFGAAVVGSIAMIASAYHWPRSSGPLLVQYELRLPPGTPPPLLNEIGISIRSENGGSGVFIARIRQSGDRPEVSGDLVIYLDNLSPTMALRLRLFGGAAEGSWQLPYRPESPLENEFGPWQGIEFIARPNAEPLPAGDYEIRYRARRYLPTY
jgi:hypothetical protein